MEALAHRVVVGVLKTAAVTSNSGELFPSIRDAVERGKGGEERGVRGGENGELGEARGAVNGEESRRDRGRCAR